MVRPVHPVQRDNPETMAHPAIQAGPAMTHHRHNATMLRQPDAKLAQRHKTVNPDRQDHPAHPVRLDNRELLLMVEAKDQGDHLDRRDRLASLDTKDHLDSLAHPDNSAKDRPKLDRLDQLAHPDNQEIPEHQDSLDKQVIRADKDRRAMRAGPDNLDNQEALEHPVKPVVKAVMANVTIAHRHEQLQAIDQAIEHRNERKKNDAKQANEKKQMPTKTIAIIITVKIMNDCECGSQKNATTKIRNGQ